jgi:tetratricopeptide (TPR) repeat protein
MKIYCEHGALSESLRELQRKGCVELIHFPYDPSSRSSHLTTADAPSAAQLRDLHLPISELPATLKDYTGSEHLSEILEILGPQNRRDALHVDTALKNNCSAFVTRDNGVLAQKARLETALGILFFHPDTDRDELERFVSGDSDMAHDDAETHFKLGMAAQLRGDTKAATAEYRKVLHLQPGNAKALVFLGIMHEGRDIAITECRQALHREPDKHAVRGVLVDALRDKGELNAAIAECQAWLRFEPASALAHEIHASLLKEKGDVEGAIAEYGEALRLESSDLWVHYDLGRLLEAKNDLDAALAEYKQVLKLSPHTDEEVFHGELCNEARRRVVTVLLRRGDLLAALREYAASISTALGRKLLVQYGLLLLAVSALAWSLGVPILQRPGKYLPRIAVLPLAIMLLAYCYQRFLKRHQ